MTLGPEPLPIDDLLPQLVASLAATPNLVVCAPPGAGKTTRVPPALLGPLAKIQGRIVVLEPRRMAARAAARRIAAERGTSLGEEIGYQVRFDQRIGPHTRVAVVTPGILLRMLDDDPTIDGVGAVVFDEFHDHSLDCDLALGMVRRIQETLRPELRIVVMSATLEANPVAQFLKDCPVINCEGRLYPVTVYYTPVRTTFQRRPLRELVAAAVESATDQTQGDILVFLPGVGEIRQTAAELKAFAESRNFSLFELYGDLPPEQQDAVLAPHPRRKLVLATNVAETSLTIPGVTGVVDSGLARQLRFDPSVDLDRLTVVPISKASAAQRAGRAGRTAPGICLRLWDEGSHAHREPFEQPEIRRVDLASAVLRLWAWGETDVLAFPWLDPPSTATVERALALLSRLGAIESGRLTELGRSMARLPVHPRIGRLLIEGHRRGCARRAALAAALLSERDPFRHSAGDARTNDGRPVTRANYVSRSDVLDRVLALEEFDAGKSGDAPEARTGHKQDSSFDSMNRGAAAFVLRARDQLLGEIRREFGDRIVPEARDPDAFLQSLLTAFPDRLARRRNSSSAKAVMVGGRGVCLGPKCAVTAAEFFLCIDVDAGNAEAIVRQASAVERDWLPEAQLLTVDEIFFHPTQKAVVARRRTCWDDLVIAEVNVPVTPGEESARILSEAAWQNWERVFPSDDRDVAGFLTRVRCLAAWMPELSLPAFDDCQLKEILKDISMTCRSLDELRKAPWRELLKGRLSYAQIQAVEREAPERLVVPSGSSIALTYESGRPPILAVRIQEMFGLLETPRVAGGRVPVVVHLLAPNMRAQQITDDLKSFWANGYPQVRKDLRGRYPKHAWPEDPRTAQPSRGTGGRPRKGGTRRDAG